MCIDIMSQTDEIKYLFFNDFTWVIRRLEVGCYGQMAESEGFEPPVPLRAQRFSRPPVSTAHPALQPIDTNQLTIETDLCSSLPLVSDSAESRARAAILVSSGSGLM